MGILYFLINFSVNLKQLFFLSLLVRKKSIK